MKRGVEAVQRARAHLVHIKVEAAPRVGLRGDYVNSRTRPGADHVIDDPAPGDELIRVVDLSHLVYVTAVLVPHHPAPGNSHAGGIGHHGLLEGDLGPVGKAGDHVGLLPPAPGERLLGQGGPVVVLETLDVPAEQGRESDPLHETVEVHLGARLVAVATGDDHPGTIRMPLEDRPQRAIELGIDQDHVLAMLDRVQSHLCPELHGSGRLNQGVDAIGPTQDCRIVGDRELPAGDRVLQLGAGGDPPHRLDAGAGIRGLGCLDVTVRYGHQLHPFDRADDLLG